MNTDAQRKPAFCFQAKPVMISEISDQKNTNTTSIKDVIYY